MAQEDHITVSFLKMPDNEHLISLMEPLLTVKFTPLRGGGDFVTTQVTSAPVSKGFKSLLQYMALVDAMTERHYDTENTFFTSHWNLRPAHSMSERALSCYRRIIATLLEAATGHQREFAVELNYNLAAERSPRHKHGIRFACRPVAAESMLLEMPSETAHLQTASRT